MVSPNPFIDAFCIVFLPVLSFVYISTFDRKLLVWFKIFKYFKFFYVRRQPSRMVIIKRKPSKTKPFILLT